MTPTTPAQQTPIDGLTRVQLLAFNDVLTRAQNAEVRATALLEALNISRERISSAPHGDNCYLSDNYDGDPGNGCNCGKESLLAYLDEIIVIYGSQP